MTAPTLAEIVEAAAKAAWDENCPENAARWDAQSASLHREWHETILPAVTATLAALEPLATEWEADAKKYDQLADEAFSDGGRELAANVYRAIANTNARHALQVRDVIGGIKQ